MAEKVDYLRFRRLSHLHDEWCKLSNDLIQQGTAINCVVASAHMKIDASLLYVEYHPDYNLDLGDLWRDLAIAASGSCLQEEGAHLKKTDSDNISLINICAEFVHFNHLLYSPPVRYLS